MKTLIGYRVKSLAPKYFCPKHIPGHLGFMREGVFLDDDTSKMSICETCSRSLISVYQSKLGLR